MGSKASVLYRQDGELSWPPGLPARCPTPARRYWPGFFSGARRAASGDFVMGKSTGWLANGGGEEHPGQCSRNLTGVSGRRARGCSSCAVLENKFKSPGPRSEQRAPRPVRSCVPDRGVRTAGTAAAGLVCRAIPQNQFQNPCARSEKREPRPDRKGDLGRGVRTASGGHRLHRPAETIPKPARSFRGKRTPRPTAKPTGVTDGAARGTRGAGIAPPADTIPKPVRSFRAKKTPASSA